MNELKIKIVKMYSKVQVPKIATVGSAGVDLRANLEQDLIFPAGESILVPTGLKIEIPLGIVGLIFARSGVAFKHGISLINAVGVIDSDYRGEIKVSLHNFYQKDFIIHDQDRIAQMLFTPYYLPKFEIVKDLSITNRDKKGFGSTGLN